MISSGVQIEPLLWPPDAGYGFLDAATEIPGVVSVAMLGPHARAVGPRWDGKTWDYPGITMGFLV